MLATSALSVDSGIKPLPLGLERMRRLPSIVLAMADQAVVSGANFLVIVALARCVPVEDFGLFTLALSCVLFVCSLIYAVVDLPISVFAPERDREGAAAYLARLEMVHRILIPILLACAVPVGLWLGDWPLVIASAMAAALRMGVEYHRRVAYAAQDSLRALLVDGVSSGSLAVAALVMLAHPVTCQAWHALAAMAATALAGWIIGFQAHRHMIAMRAPEPLQPVFRRHWGFGKWSLGGALAMWGASQLYPFLVAGFLGLREVAVLNGSIRILGVSNVLVQGIEAFTTPRLRKQIVDQDVRGFRMSMLLLFSIGIAVMLPFCALMMAWPREALLLFLGEKFTHGVVVMQIIALAQFFSFLSRLSSIGLNALKQPKPGFWSQLICAAVTMMAGPLIVRHGGLMGACLALLFNAIVLFLVTTGSFHRIFRRSGWLKEAQ